MQVRRHHKASSFHVSATSQPAPRPLPTSTSAEAKLSAYFAKQYVLPIHVLLDNKARAATSAPAMEASTCRHVQIETRCPPVASTLPRLTRCPTPHARHDLVRKLLLLGPEQRRHLTPRLMERRRTSFSKHRRQCEPTFGGTRASQETSEIRSRRHGAPKMKKQC